jgi:hypothetical protein
MAFTDLRVYTNCDYATIIWRTDAPIKNCRGFALERQVAGASGDAADGFVNTYVGFAEQKPEKATVQPSTIWPIQRYIWSDYAVSQGQKVCYRVIPMLRNTANGPLVKAAQSEWSGFSDWASVVTEQTPGFGAYFNRGIVPAQFLAKQLQQSGSFKAMLSKDISTPGSANRTFLSGVMRVEILALLDKAKRDGINIYAALYELNDPELMDRLIALGQNCSLILGSGAYKPGVPDENAAARKQLKGKIRVFDRIVTSPHYAHNKFLVLCDAKGNPSSVWTGSMNWTMTGLCTQVNNAVYIKCPELATGYKDRWDALMKAKSSYPATLAGAGSQPTKATISKVEIAAWQDPCLKYANLNDAAKYIQGAKEGVLFLMFNPGTGDGKTKAYSLLQDIQKLDPDSLFIRGVVNQDQSPTKGATVALTSGSATAEAGVDVITPHALTSTVKNWFHREFQYNMVMIHSKVVVVDPFGKHPVVMTGSDNMGPKASPMTTISLSSKMLPVWRLNTL